LVVLHLSKLTKLGPHQLAGHVANLEFWVAQARSALLAIDSEQERHQRGKSAQLQHAMQNRITDSIPGEPTTDRLPDDPKQTPSVALNAARRWVKDATYRFLVRCFHDGLIAAEQVRAICNDLSIEVERSDLRNES
jgi:hypothetical protein